MRRYACGVPTSICQGAMTIVPRSLKGMKTHGSRMEAFRCRVAWLLAQGYTRIGGREFRPPGGIGPVMVLTKKSRFGGELRGGKRGVKGTDGSGGTQTAKRMMWAKGRGQAGHGVIVG